MQVIPFFFDFFFLNNFKIPIKYLYIVLDKSKHMFYNNDIATLDRAFAWRELEWITKEK